MKKTFIFAEENRRKNMKGFSTIEILIAFSVFVIFISAAMMVAFGGQSAGLDTILDNNGFTRSLNKIGEATKKLAANWDAELTSDTDTANDFNYTNTPDVFDTSECIKRVSNNTTWDTEQSRDRNIFFVTYISDIDTARALGRGECGSGTDDEWDNPENPGWETSPSDIDGTQSGLDVVTIDGTPYAFMTTTHNSQKDDLWAIDVSDIENPDVVKSLETGDATHKDGLVDIDVVTTDTGTYAYVIQNSSTNQLQTIDVSNPISLNAADITSTLSLAAYGVTPTGSDPIPKVITYYNGKLYIGLYNTTGPEFLVFDVSSNPENPSFVGSIASNFNHSINDIVVTGNYAYLAIKPGTGGGAVNTKELMILDISNPTPTDTGKGFNASSTANDTEAATALYLIGNKLYLGRERVSNASEKDFYAFNISNKTLPTPIKSKRLGISTGGSLGTPRVIDLIVQGKLGFLVTTDSTKPFQIFDMVSDPNDIVPIASCNNYLNLPKLVEIVYLNELIYGANGNQAALNILHDQPNACTP